MPKTPSRSDKQYWSKKYPGVYYTIPAKGPKDKIYHVRYTDRYGKRRCKTIGRASKRITERHAYNIRQQLLHKERQLRSSIPGAQLTLDDGFDIFIERQKARRKYWEEDQSRYNRHIREPFGKKRLADITTEDVEKFRDKLRNTESRNGGLLSEASVRQYVGIIRRVYNYLRKTNRYKGLNPCDGVEFPTLRNEVNERLTPEQETNLLQVLKDYPNQTVANIIRLAFFTGMRKGEILRLKWSDISEDYKSLDLGITKGGRHELIPINDTMREIFEKQRKLVPKGEEYIFPGKYGGKINNFHKAWRTIKARAGIPVSFRFHGLRHHFAGKLASDPEVSMFTLQKVMRHKDIHTTCRYIEIPQEETLEAMNKFASSIHQPAKSSAKTEMEDGV